MVLAASVVFAHRAGAEERLTPFDASSPAFLQQAHAGKAYVIVFWSVSCAPCLAEMPAWRARRQRHPDVPIIHVATEPIADAEIILGVLDRYDPGTTGHRAFADDHAEPIRHAVDPAWRGETPKAYFFDRRHVRTVQTGTVDPAWVSQWLERQRAGR